MGLQRMVVPVPFHLCLAGQVGQPNMARLPKLERVVLRMRMNVLMLMVRLTNEVILPYPRRILKGQGFGGVL